MDQTQTDDQELAQAHAQQLDSELIKLRTLSEAGVHKGYKDFWTYSKQIIGLFKSLKPISSEDRQRLWSAYREICDEAHRRQTDLRSQLQSGSRAVREQIEAEISQARQYLTDDAGPEHLSQARELLRSALSKMKGPGKDAPNQNMTPEPTSSEAGEQAVPDADHESCQPLAEATPPQPRLLKEDREECWRQWQEVRQDVQTRLDAKLQIVSMRAQELVSRAQSENPPAVLKAIREVQQDAAALGLVKGPREQLRSVLNEAWKVAISRLQALREERKARHQEWRTRMESNLERWQDQVARRDQSITHLREQVEKLEAMFENARTDEHRERVRTWIGETQEKLSKHEAAAASIREKIVSVESKLGR